MSVVLHHKQLCNGDTDRKPLQEDVGQVGQGRIVLGEQATVARSFSFTPFRCLRVNWLPAEESNRMLAQILTKAKNGYRSFLGV